MFVQRFRGREMAHPQLGEERLNQIASVLSDISAVVAAPRMNGRQMTLTLAPDKQKLATIKAKQERELRVASPQDEAGEQAVEGEEQQQLDVAAEAVASTSDSEETQNTAPDVDVDVLPTGDSEEVQASL